MKRLANLPHLFVTKVAGSCLERRKRWLSEGGSSERLTKTPSCEQRASDHNFGLTGEIVHFAFVRGSVESVDCHVDCVRQKMFSKT